MDTEKFTVIQGSMGRSKTTLIGALILGAGLFLLGSILLDLHLTILNVDLALCDLRRKLARIRTDVQDFSFTVTASPTPATVRKDAFAPIPEVERTENT